MRLSISNCHRGTHYMTLLVGKGSPVIEYLSRVRYKAINTHPISIGNKRRWLLILTIMSQNVHRVTHSAPAQS